MELLSGFLGKVKEIKLKSINHPSRLIVISLLFLFFLGIFIARIPLFIDVKGSQAINYIWATISTFLGVFLAFLLSEIANERKKKEEEIANERKRKEEELNIIKNNKEKAIKVLQATYEAISQFSIRIEALIKFNDLNAIRKDIIIFPSVVESLTTELFYIEILSNEVLYQIRGHSMNIETSLKAFNNLYNEKLIKIKGHNILFWIGKLSEALDIESRFLQNNISIEQHSEKFKKHVESIMEMMKGLSDPKTKK